MSEKDWRYDEDGYCIACGNGQWKHHMPDCGIADLDDETARLSGIIWHDGEPWDREGYCYYCDGNDYTDREHPVATHEPDCPWLSEFLKREAAGQAEGPELGPPRPWGYQTERETAQAADAHRQETLRIKRMRSDAIQRWANEKQDLDSFANELRIHRPWPPTTREAG